MKFTSLPFGLLNLAVIAGLLLASSPVSANPVEILQFVDQTPSADGLQFFDLGNHPAPDLDNQQFIPEQESPEGDEVFVDEEGDVLQFIADHGHEDVVFVNDDGEIEVEEFIDVDNLGDSSRSYPGPSSDSGLPEGSPSNELSTEENFSRDFSPELNSTDANLTRDFTPENNSTLENNSTERGFTDGYSTGNRTFGFNSTASPNGEEDEGVLDGILNFFENLFSF